MVKVYDFALLLYAEKKKIIVIFVITRFDGQIW